MEIRSVKKKNTAANLPEITAVKSSVDFVNPLKFVIAAAVFASFCTQAVVCLATGVRRKKNSSYL